MTWTPIASPAPPWNVGWFSDGASQLLPAPDGSMWLVSTSMLVSPQTHVLRFNGVSWTSLPDIGSWPFLSSWFGAAFVGGVLHVVGVDVPGGTSRFIVVSYDASSGALTLVSSTPVSSFMSADPDRGPYRTWAGLSAGKLWVLADLFSGLDQGSYFVGYDLAAHTWEAHSFLATQYARGGLAADPEGALWTVGGYMWSLGHVISDIARFDTTSLTYTTVGHLPAIVQDPAVTIIDRTLHILGGFFAETSEEPSWYTFDLDTHVLTQQPDLPTLAASYGSEAGAIGHDLYFGGGFSDVLNKDIGFWIQVAPPPPGLPPAFLSSTAQEPPVKSGKYRYLFHDLLTNNPLAELELKNVSYDYSLNAPGGFSASLNIASQQATMENVIGSTTPGRTAVYIDRNGTITWGGILWKRRYSASNRTVTLEGKTFESYFARRRIVDSLSYPNTDQLAVMRSLINNMQAKPGGSIGIEVGNELSGRAIDAFFFWFELKPYLEVLQEFGGVQHGFDFRVRCFRDSETKLIRKVLEFGYPHLGRTALQTNLLFEYPNSNIVTYNWDEDAESGADVFHATGANEGEALMVSTATSPMLLDQGWPLLEDSNAYADVTLWADLDARSQSDLQSHLVPISTPSLTVFGDADPILGSYLVGDFARFRIRDDRFPLGVDITQRLYGLKVTVDAAGTREKIDLTVGVQH